MSIIHDNYSQVKTEKIGLHGFCKTFGDLGRVGTRGPWTLSTLVIRLLTTGAISNQVRNSQIVWSVPVSGQNPRMSSRGDSIIYGATIEIGGGGGGGDGGHGVV